MEMTFKVCQRRPCISLLDIPLPCMFSNWTYLTFFFTALHCHCSKCFSVPVRKRVRKRAPVLTLLSLPEEVLLCVLQCLSAEDLLAVRAVSKHTHTLLVSNSHPNTHTVTHTCISLSVHKATSSPWMCAAHLVTKQTDWQTHIQVHTAGLKSCKFRPREHCMIKTAKTKWHLFPHRCTLSSVTSSIATPVFGPGSVSGIPGPPPQQSGSLKGRCPISPTRANTPNSPYLYPFHSEN